MSPNFVGLAAGLATFLGIWFGHVTVRKLERSSHALALPATCFIAAGIFLEAGARLATDPALCAAVGILGMACFWDAYEFFRQEKRVKKGHAPANPYNPRHARILSTHQTATRLDLLQRDPVGHVVDPIEAALLIAYKPVDSG